MCVRDKCADDAQLIIQFCRNISVCIQVGVDRILFGHNRRVSGAARHFYSIHPFSLLPRQCALPY